MSNTARVLFEDFARQPGAVPGAAELAAAVKRLAEQTQVLRQLEEGFPARYCGCLSELSLPCDSCLCDELSLLFDQAEIADEMPNIVHGVVRAEEVIEIESAMAYACMGAELVDRVMNSGLVDVTDEEVELVGYLGWACQGSLKHA